MNSAWPFWLRAARLAAARGLVGAASLGVGGAAQAQHPHADVSGVVGLDVFAQERTVDALLAVRNEAGVEISHRRSSDGGASWGAAASLGVPAAQVFRPQRGNEPQLAAFHDQLVAVWTEPGKSRFGSGPLATALSSDAGKTWRRGPSPADDAPGGGHGYVDVLADETGTFYVVWLDSRDGGQGLRASVSRDAGASWAANQSVDKRTCECCWNRLASLKPGLAAVLYRDKDPRDMAVATTRDAGRGWDPGSVAGAFAWQFAGCPHVGGGLAASRGRSGLALHALVWTGREGREGLYLLTSPDSGRTWGSPKALGDAGARHGDLAASADRLAAVWDLRAGPSSAVLASLSKDGGASWSTPERLSEPGLGASHPLVVGTGDGGFLVAWTESPQDGSARWRSRRLGP